jgi:hypothetical protein
MLSTTEEREFSNTWLGDPNLHGKNLNKEKEVVIACNKEWAKKNRVNIQVIKFKTGSVSCELETYKEFFIWVSSERESWKWHQHSEGWLLVWEVMGYIFIILLGRPLVKEDKSSEGCSRRPRDVYASLKL